MPKKVNVNRILVIRLSAMGDVAMTVPVILALSKNYPELKVTLLTKAGYAPIFQSLDTIEVIPVHVKNEHKGVFGLIKLFMQLRKMEFDCVVDLHNVLRSNLLIALFRMTGVKAMQLNKARREKKRLTRPKNKVFAPLAPITERYAQTVEKMGLELNFKQPYLLPKAPIPEKLLQLLNRHSNAKLVGIAPFAAFPSKMYDLELMHQLIEALLETVDCTVLLFGGGPDEAKKIARLEQAFDQRVVGLAGKMTLVEELAVISNLDVMLGMDSSNGHLAANYGVPVITLWGVTHPYAGFFPYGQPLENALLPNLEQFPLIPTSVYGNKFPEGYENAINTIPTANIIDKIKAVLGVESR